MKHRNKHMRGDRKGEGTEEADSAKTTRISLSFPLSAGLPSFSAQKHCSSSHPASSTDVHGRDGSDSTAWMGEAFRDKQLSKTSSKTDRLPCASSSFPVDLTAPVSKNCKSSLSFSVDGSGSRYPTSPLQHSNKIDYSKETAGVSLNNGYKEHSTTETAHILFNLSARAYQDQGVKDPESSKGKKRKANSLHVELSLPLPSINPHSSSSTPPPPPSPSSVSLTSSPLTIPTPSFHNSFRTVPKPELLCGVCHRLFSTASSLTVHMRLHRGGRVLSCRHCGKAFIHNKRLQSHEATCRQGLPAFPVPPKEEPLEEGEVEGERADEAAEPEQLGQETRPGRPIKKVRHLHAHHAGTLTCSDALEEEDHFVKVVDGHIIYFCSVCERSYMTLSSLKRHSNVHSWRRKYPCHYCDKVFALAEYRTKHEVWHTGERRYQCIFCWEAFPTYYNLKTHQKAFHGINPGLISSEKTANGGYKQKINALKLYRLLPMRSLKRPYKTYSQPMADGLLTSDSSVTLPLSIDSSLPQPLDTKKLESFLKDLQTPDIKTEPEGLGVEQGKKLASPQKDMAVEARETEGSDLWMSGSNSGKSKTPKCPEGAVSSVIAFAHSKPSVIMHSAAVSSSVIVHRNKTDPEERKRSPENHLMTKTGQKQIKRNSQREHTEAYREWDAVSVDSEASKMRQPTEKHHKGRKVHNKTESSKTIPLAMGSEVKGSGPLCQITVRIGEEAIVKRSISETDLRRDKSPTRSKPKKSNFSQKDHREQRHTSHHQRKHRNSSQERKEVESKWETPKLKGKVRKYFFRQEVREDRNDHDVEDNLWRPYYSYKPKRKALHMQGAKAWKRKLHYKRSLRPMKRAEKLMKNLNKEIEVKDADEGEERRQKVKKERREVCESQKTEVKEMSHSCPVFSRTEQKEKEKGTHGKPDLPLPSSVPQAPNNTQNTASSIIKQRWSEDQASECGTCGRWFSSPRKRDKHELTHLFEFVCMLCRAPFPSQFKLEEHQRTQHPKNKPLSAPTFFNSQSSRNEVEMKADDNGVDGRSIEKGSTVRLGRRPLIRYTCSQCDKVCKTSAALNCHLKRHELGSSTKVEDTQEKQDMPDSCAPSAVETTPSKGLDTNCEQVQPVSVIYYSKSDCKITDNQLGEKMEEHQRVRNCENPKVATNDKVHSPLCSQFSQVMHRPTLERFNVISPNLPSVLVMNGAECLDYRTPEKRNLDTLDQQKRSPMPSDRQIQVSQMLTEPQIRRETIPSGLISLKAGRSYVFREGDNIPNEDFSDLQDAQDLRLFPQSSSQAQDLSMPTIWAKNKELVQQIKHPSNISKEQSCNEEVSLLVPKEEPLSPIPSPTCSVIQTTPKGSSQRYSKSPCHSPGPLDLQLRPQVEQSQSHRGRHNTEKQGLMLPANSAGMSDTPSSHNLLHPQVPRAEPESKDNTSITPTEHHRGLGYPVQELTLPLVIPGGYCSGKKQEEQILMSYPAGPLPFPPLGKMVPHSDATKLPLYPDPYHLLYGPQLLPYPYNLAALPMALNMMASGDKEPLPFLPFFNYAAAAAPLTGTVPHPLVVNPSLYNSGGSSSTKQDNP
ncbi:zinc finger and BTB domain-containing protein 38-like [Sinocyclocheilus anshuiensis]|uniref:Zinc finger and BTB domain-containing protein 38-like n=1 Tax=Sinocyclocheilus anshuiensis TaxID=1608454 RepID=A0A671QSR9_9TELE|nr:PREDICTED: zinc finger and BTB domain-containing protein 38-like [Sinocyclocheilus anshuiensis]